MRHLIILTDADNTLWDTDAVFANAQTGLLEVVENATSTICSEGDRLAFVRRYDQALAAIHHSHLKYPPMLLIRALELALHGTDARTTADLVVRGAGSTSALEHSEIEIATQQYLAMLESAPTLLPTVLDGLIEANDANITVYVLTEGALERQKSILSHHSLGPYVAGIFEAPKNQAQFARLKQRFAPAEVVVIGDQPDRDVVPAKNAGCTAVLVPSRFRPQWHDSKQWSNADFIARTFNEGIEWILRRLPVSDFE